MNVEETVVRLLHIRQSVKLSINECIALENAIKTLEQEPILDKIRSEIIENSIEDYEYHGCGTHELIIETSEVLQIIDEYRK